MCYPKPGPRCSSYAAKSYARAQIACSTMVVDLSLEDPKDRETFDTMLARRDKAKREYFATPAGIATLEQNLRDATSDYQKEDLQRQLQDAKDYRAHLLSLVKAKDTGDIGSHNDSKTVPQYGKLGFTTEFARADEDRLGWSAHAISEDVDENERTRIKKVGQFLTRASTVWMDKMTPEEVSTMSWLTNDGSHIMVEHTAGNSEKISRITSIPPEELDRRLDIITSACNKAPRLKEPVVLYRGLQREAPFDLEEVKKTGEYTAPTALSSSLNPGVANSFGYKNIILEFKTRKFPTPTNFSYQHHKESEVLIPPGAKFKLVGVQEGVRAGWTKDTLVDGYTIVQLEEVE